MIINSLINILIEYSDKNYRSIDCEHIHAKCEKLMCYGNCSYCLDQIHFPKKYNKCVEMKTDYDCKKIICFYICDFLIRYCSEIYYLLKYSKIINEIDNLRIVSIGCGDCPDLIAFEEYLKDSHITNIDYIGIDTNKLWMDIHNVIREYYNKIISKRFNINYSYDGFLNFDIDRYQPNVIVIQYLFSYLHSHNLHYEIDLIVDKIKDYVNNIFCNDTFYVLINDINSSKVGRDVWFNQLKEKLHYTNIRCSLEIYYFYYNDIYEKQMIGECHISNEVVFEFPDHIDYSCYNPWKECRSIQMLIKINKGDV